MAATAGYRGVEGAWLAFLRLFIIIIIIIGRLYRIIPYYDFHFLGNKDGLLFIMHAERHFFSFFIFLFSF